jgi:hypothetical protein
MSPLHGPTALRAALLCAGLTLVLHAVASVLAPTLLDLFGGATASGLVLASGVLVRLVAGRLAARRAWDDGADLVLVLVSVGVGGAVGWLLFPGLLSLVGVLGGSGPPGSGVGQGLARLLLDLVAWLVCLLVGAAGARWTLRRKAF